MTIKQNHMVKQLYSFVKTCFILLRYRVLNRLWKNVPNTQNVIPAPCGSNLLTDTLSIGLKEPNTSPLNKLNLRKSLESSEIEGRVYFRIRSDSVSSQVRDDFFDLCRKMYHILGSEQAMKYPAQIGAAVTANGQYITIDVYGSRVGVLDRLSTILFEAHISLGIVFEKCVPVKFSDISSDVSLLDGTKNLIIDFDYVDHTYSVYDVNTLLTTIDNKHKEAV